MFERYTEGARRTLFFARYEASQRGSLSIECEHVLVGLIRESKGPVARLLARFQVLPHTLLRDVDARTQLREKVPTSKEIPFSEDTKHCLEFARQEADGFRHSHIGTEHLFLGLLRADRSVAASILTGHGVTLKAARDQVGTEPSAPSPTDEVSGASGWIESIKLLVEQLGRTEANSADGRALVARIHFAVDALKPYLGRS
jgi:ATP-dependent Clp protease ATP-binding subunit ClpC